MKESKLRVVRAEEPLSDAIFESLRKELEPKTLAKCSEAVEKAVKKELSKVLSELVGHNVELTKAGHGALAAGAAHAIGVIAGKMQIEGFGIFVENRLKI